MIGLKADNHLVVRSSRMSRANALYLLEQAKLHSLGPD